MIVAICLLGFVRCEVLPKCLMTLEVGWISCRYKCIGVHMHVQMYTCSFLQCSIASLRSTCVCVCVCAAVMSKAASAFAKTPAALAEKMVALLPKLQLVGNNSIDSDAKAERKLMTKVFEYILTDPGCVMTVSDVLDSRKQAKQKIVDEAQLHPKMTTASRIPSEVMVAELASISDMDVTDITGAKGKDSEADKQLWAFAIGMPMSWKFGPEMRTKKVMTDVVTVRDDIMGNRIANFKGLGGCKSVKPLDLTFGVYKATFQGDELKQVRHWNGDTVQVDELGKHIDRTWIIQSNWATWMPISVSHHLHHNL